MLNKFFRQVKSDAGGASLFKRENNVMKKLYLSRDEYILTDIFVQVV